MAAVDVYEEEPVLDTDASAARTWTTSCARRTSATSTRDEYEIQFSDIFDQIVAYAAGKPINVVNPEVLEAKK